MKKKILIVDDNTHLTSFLEKRLSDAGYEVITATSGLAAVKALADFSPEIIFSDYYMPNITGDQLCRIIRRMDDLSNVHIIIMSAAASELNLNAADIGADAIIAKGSFKEMEENLLSIIEDMNAGRLSERKNTIGRNYATSRQLTKELIAKHVHLQALLDSISVAVVEVCENSVVYANAATLRIFAKTMEQTLAFPLPDLFHDAVRSEITSLMTSAAEDSFLIRQPGAEGYPELTLTIRKLPQQSGPGCGIFLIDDVTERMRNEKSLRDSQKHLEKLVQERTSDLRQTYEMLQQSQKLEAVGTMAGGIAHDFNNILGGMIGYMELARLEAAPDRRKHYIDEALNISNRAKNLINQLLIFSRPQEHQPKPIPLRQIIKDSIKLLRPIIPSTISITQTITDKDALILGDAVKIQQILINLCSNAHHAMREKGGVLDIRLEREFVAPDDKPSTLGLAPGKYAKLTVSDTGNGIDPAIIDRVFDPFFTTKNPGEGTGLGLSVVYGIVRDHGGKIDIASEKGKGARLSVFLPLVEASASAAESIQAAEPTPKGNERILFIDDESTIVEVVGEMLTSLGYRVTPKNSSMEALDLFRSKPDAFDLVITDMTMPGLRGDELTKELLKIRQDMPIIMCTGFNEMISERRAKEIGIRQFLMKPLRLKDLGNAVRQALS